MKRNTTN